MVFMYRVAMSPFYRTRLGGVPQSRCDWKLQTIMYTRRSVTSIRRLTFIPLIGMYRQGYVYFNKSMYVIILKSPNINTIVMTLLSCAGFGQIAGLIMTDLRRKSSF